MPRARNIKHAFFTDDELAEYNDPLGRLLFIGLWTISDFNGNVEWRPRKIKAQLLPYDDCDIKKIVINLDKSRFIRIYSNANKLYINIPNFIKHQRPHINEIKKGTSIPEFDEITRQAIDFNTLSINPDSFTINHDPIGAKCPDPCFLIPDSFITIYEPNHETLEFIKAHKLTTPRPEHIAGFISHHQLKKTRFSDERETHCAFRKWMSNDKLFSAGNNYEQNKQSNRKLSAVERVEIATREKAEREGYS